MKEDFLHYIWKYRLFATSNLYTAQKEAIQVVSPGLHNFNTGPDFFNAKIEIDDQLWAGNVEIHVKSSDWYVHGHEKDQNYDNVILHIVWEHDIEIYRKDTTVLPTVELKNFINKNILSNYKKLFSRQRKWINCEKEIALVDEFLLNNWLERLYIERLEEKSKLIDRLLKDSKNDWEAVLFKLLAKNFGLKVNSEAFLDLASKIDFNIIRKQRHDLKSLEALFFGQADLLKNSLQEPYYLQLQKEYRFLRSKFNLNNNFNTRFEFFRLRPNNFPTIRIAQLAALYNHDQNLFSKIMSVNQLKAFYKLFNVSVSDYWKTHYSFFSESRLNNKKLSKSFIDLLVINTILPLKFVYLKSNNKLDVEKLLATIKEVKSEKNAIIEKFNLIGVKSKNAFETQALLQLKNEYCSKQKCLQCAIGNTLISSK